MRKSLLRTKSSAILSLGIVFLGFFCVFSGRPLEAKIIQAEIEHKDYLPEVPENFRRGQILKEGDLAVRVQWFPVPDWMAGTFTKSGDLETFQKDFQSGAEKRQSFWLKNRVTLKFGHQRDRLNTVWHAEVVPFRADGARGATRDQRYVLSMACLKSTPENVVLKFHSVVVTLDDRGKVMGSKQQEEIVSFFPKNDNFISSTSSTKIFSERGQPLYQLDSHTSRLRVNGFQEVDRLSGIDLRNSLDQFLSAKNMTDRLSGSP